MRGQLGLDRPGARPVCADWLAVAVRGDLGTSLTAGASVAGQLTASLGPTLSLVGLSLLVSAIAGLALGVTSAVRGGVLGRALDMMSLAGLAVPS